VGGRFEPTPAPRSPRATGDPSPTRPAVSSPPLAGSRATLDFLLPIVRPKAVKGRWRTPPPARYLPIPFGPPIGWTSLKYLLDVGFTRDVWAHRIDLSKATGREMYLPADHDGRLVADIVGEWASIYDQPFELVLEGPAGGKFSLGTDGERVEIDAIDFIRVLSGAFPEPACSPIRCHADRYRRGARLSTRPACWVSFMPVRVRSAWVMRRASMRCA
jgi:hypothetical protein